MLYSHFRALLAVFALIVSVHGTVAQPQDWPQFRGLTAGTAADDPSLPDTWSTTENVTWSVDIPGLGWSSPIVVGDHVFITSAISAGDERQPVSGLYDPGEDYGKMRSVFKHR